MANQFVNGSSSISTVNDVKITFACQENWLDFREVAGGRFCKHCQHIVHDFTNATPRKWQW